MKKNSNEEDYKIIPFNYMPTQFFTISFLGFKDFAIDRNDEEFNRMIQLASETLNSFRKIYKDTHAFTEPSLSYKQDGTCELRIGIMENERFEALKLKENFE